MLRLLEALLASCHLLASGAAKLLSPLLFLVFSAARLELTSATWLSNEAAGPLEVRNMLGPAAHRCILLSWLWSGTLATKLFPSQCCNLLNGPTAGAAAAIAAELTGPVADLAIVDDSDCSSAEGWLENALDWCWLGNVLGSSELEGWLGSALGAGGFEEGWPDA